MDDLAQLQAQLDRCTQSNDWAQAVETIKRIVEAQPESVLKAMAAVQGAEISRYQLGLVDEALEFYEMALDCYFANFDALTDEMVPVALMPFEATERLLTERGDWKALDRAYRKMIVRVRGAPRFDALRARLFRKLGDVYRERLDQPSSAEAAYGEAAKLEPAALTWNPDDPRMNDPMYAGSSEPRPVSPQRSVDELKAALESPQYLIRMQAFDELMKAFDLTTVMHPPEATGEGSVLELLRTFIARDAKAFNRIARDELIAILDKLAAGASPGSLGLAWKPDDSPELTEHMQSAIADPDVAFPVEEIRDATGFTRRRWEGLLAMRLEVDDARCVDALVQLNATWTLPVLEELAESDQRSPELREKIAGAVRYLKVSADAGSLN